MAPLQVSVLAAGLLAGLALSGCGSDSSGGSQYPSGTSDRDQIEAVVGYFNTAAADLNADLLCQEVISPSARGVSAETCAENVGRAMHDAPENWSGGKITGISHLRVRGDSATATGVWGGARGSLTFEREAGRWWMQVFD